MRDIRRIDRILDKIKEHWLKSPDQRFTQLLINMRLVEDGMHWHVDDDVIEKLLNKEFDWEKR